MQIWRVDVHDQSLKQEPVPANWEHLGGRGLLARIMLDETPPDCEPLGWDNKLIFSPGLLVGHMLSSCDRLSGGSKSPLTGGIKESNAGGRTGLHMAHLGMKALIIEGRSPECAFWNVCLWNPFLAGFDYRYEQVTLNGSQADVQSNGSWRLVVAPTDPGHPNWLSTAGHRSGVVWFRWFLPESTPPPLTTRVVPTSELTSS